MTVRAATAVILAAVVAALTGCSAASGPAPATVTVTATPSKTDSVPSPDTELQRVTLDYATESSCSGTVDADVPKGSLMQDGKATAVVNGVAVIVAAFCDSKDRYEENGLTSWDLDSVNELTYGQPLTELENYNGQAVTVSGQPGYRWSYTANGEWWFAQSSIVGDNYETVQVEVQLPTVATDTKSLADRILNKVEVHIG